MGTHVLFFSAKCKHCTKLLSIVKDLKEIECVSVDTLKNIPAYVRGVPGLLVNRNDIIYGEKVFNFVNDLKKEKITAVNEDLGDFSFIQDDNYIDNLSNGYTKVGEEGNIIVGAIESTNETKNEYIDPNIIEKLIQERNNDLPEIKQRL